MKGVCAPISPTKGPDQCNWNWLACCKTHTHTEKLRCNWMLGWFNGKEVIYKEFYRDDFKGYMQTERFYIHDS